MTEFCHDRGTHCRDKASHNKGQGACWSATTRPGRAPDQGARATEEFYRDRKFSVAADFSHDKPGGLGAL